MDIKARIKIQIIPNPDFRIYHFTEKISEHSVHCFTFPINKKEQAKYLRDVGFFGVSLLQEVFQVKGVTEVFLRTYDISVGKGSAFEWEEVESRLLEIFKHCFVVDPKEVEVTYVEHYDNLGPIFGLW